MRDVLYNVVASIAVVAAVVAWRFHSSPRRHVSVCGLVWIVQVAAGLALGEDGFGTFRLWAWGLFIHVPALLLSTAILFFREHRKLAAAAATLAVLVAAAGADAFFVEPKRLGVTRHRMTSAKVKRPLKIVVVADIQTDVVGPHEREALRLAAAERADLVLFAGDYIQARPADRPRLIAELNALLHELAFDPPLGAYAVKGNTDAETWKEIFAGTKIRAEDATFDAVRDGVRVTALSEVASRATDTAVAESFDFHVVVGHYPNFALGDVRADLLVAGHTHGGQVQLPGVGPILTLSKIPRAWADGMTDIGNGRTLVVSRGVGMERSNAPRMRFLCVPEIVVIEVTPR